MSGLIDVVMPVYNAAPYLRQSIESILSQTFSDFTFIIIDDGSNDGSRDILQYHAHKDTRILLLKNDVNSGICISLNKAITAGSSKYIVRMDADDISYPDRLAKQVAFMEKHPEVWVAGCNVRCIDATWKYGDIKYYTTDDTHIRNQLFLFNPICHPASIVRRDIFSKTWWYNNTYILAEDLELRFAMWVYAYFANISDVLLDYRIYEHNSTNTKLRHMASQAIKVRLRAIHTYWYKPWLLWRLAIALSFVIQFLPSKMWHRLFYKLRSVILRVF